MDNWPKNADGDVLRSLMSQGFDFAKEYIVDFYIDFNGTHYDEISKILKDMFNDSSVKIYEEEKPPYIRLQLRSLVNYDFVTDTQAIITEAVRPYGGLCDSWGVFH